MASNVLVPSSVSVSTGQATMANSLPVVIASDQSIVSVKQPDLTSIAQSLSMTSATNAITLNLGTGQETVYLQITGATWTGTIIFEGNVDGSNWFSVPGVVPTTGAAVTTTTANGQWQISVAGLASVRIRVSSTGTNSATVSVQGSMGSGVVSLANSLPTGSNVIGAVTGSGSFTVQPNATTTGGCDGYRILSANNTTTLTVKSSAGTVYYISATNTNASARYVKMYNSTSASVGTTTPTHTFVVPGNANGAGFVLSIPVGQNYGTGIQAGITTGIADGDTGAPAANEVVVNIGYK